MPAPKARAVVSVWASDLRKSRVYPTMCSGDPPKARAVVSVWASDLRKSRVTPSDPKVTPK